METNSFPLYLSKLLIGNYIENVRGDLLRIFGRPTIQEEIVSLGWNNEEELLNVEFEFTFNKTDGTKRIFTYCYGDLIDSIDDYDSLSALEKEINIAYEDLRRNLHRQYLQDLYMRG